MKVDWWKGDGGCDAGEWLGMFEMATMSVAGDNASMTRAFQFRLAPGSEAQDWYDNLPRTTVASWTLTKDEFEKRWPRVVVVGMSAREKMDRFRAHKLREEDLGRSVRSESGLETPTHAFWARLHASYGRATGEQDQWLIEETYTQLPPTLRGILESKPTQSEWTAFMSSVSSISIDAILTERQKQSGAEKRIRDLETQVAALVSRAMMAPQQPINLWNQAPAPAQGYSYPGVNGPIPRVGPAQPLASLPAPSGWNPFQQPQQPQQQPQQQIHAGALIPAPPSVANAMNRIPGSDINIGPFPDTPAGRMEYDENVSAWYQKYGWEAVVKSLDTPFPYTPGTVEPGRNGCHMCGQAGHSELDGRCNGTRLPRNEVYYRRLLSKANVDRMIRALGVSGQGHDITPEQIEKGFREVGVVGAGADMGGSRDEATNGPPPGWAPGNFWI
ncbi:hypothetical protein BOTBODRAFT_33506 [Botryobasidium botryosum FD-172 SS1]|uniref:Uncharacterized protein n=1 Tax=Botryobasidium botryosum (strain FD-172 SS1) TaxID=930990 RepID=A0A067MPH8_BOTB1|nr:hypothetical protein BOTBODRAFT_33506 [Botryobasidium botryosum FD-172 SS1]